jgi:hypothetical protein
MPYYHQQPYNHHNRSHTTSGYGRQDTSANDGENPNDMNDPSLLSRTARFVTFFKKKTFCTDVRIAMTF